MMTIKEIKEAEAVGFSEMSDEKLLEAYSTINVFKRDLVKTETSVKTSLEERATKENAYNKPVQFSFPFPDGDMVYTAQTKSTTNYVLDIPLDDFIAILFREGHDVSSFVKMSISSTNLDRIKKSASFSPAVKDHITVNQQAALEIKFKKEVK